MIRASNIEITGVFAFMGGDTFMDANKNLNSVLVINNGCWLANVMVMHTIESAILSKLNMIVSLNLARGNMLDLKRLRWQWF